MCTYRNILWQATGGMNSSKIYRFMIEAALNHGDRPEEHKQPLQEILTHMDNGEEDKAMVLLMKVRSGRL